MSIRRLNTVLLIVLILIPSTLSLLYIPIVEADNGKAKIYIICLNGVPCGNYDAPDNVTAAQAVRDGVIAAANFFESTSIPHVHPKAGDEAPFYNISYQVVTDWDTYKNIILNYNDCIVINTHGEIFPVPQYYNIQWINVTANAIQNRSMTWVQTGGYPFYYTWFYGASSKTVWPTDGTWGFRNFTSNINIPDATCSPGGDPFYRSELGSYAKQTLSVLIREACTFC